MAKRRNKDQEKIYDNEAGMLALLEKVLLANNFEVYKEVSTPNGYCDIVATIPIGGKIYRWGIEGKMVCSDAVIAQAHNNIEFFDYVSICTPKDPNWIYRDFMKRNGIGCIGLSQSSYFPEEAIKGELHMWEGESKVEILPNVFTQCYSSLHHTLLPILNPRPKSERVTLHELHKLEMAGKSAGERLTTYKLTVMKIQEYLKGRGWVPIKTILVDLKDDLYWSNPRNGLYNVCHWEEEKFEQKREGMVSFMKLKE